ncbi:Putative TrmH family tRNA/rRNA methyltransferase [Jeotgalicoccus saudimassiliensis]|uniref:Putative TrmH family tRNA/rRNA methyltransferase n=1 Tax=Jeotgalicoccus saudimassiliensis TaxID=1461582 RepID=A0A078M350_9STAP|nr:RNA methyltransferase [Jeotgalicoccus saudimassiliensis]CEA00660.1 Putative TrmH family tRNA/rRNA methyltransferase [Jeotgalicoccus saudimassiliensis]
MVKEVISSKDNTRIKNYRKLHTAKGRKKSEQFLIEGVHLVEEAVNYNQPVDVIIIEDGFNHELNIDKFKVLYVSRDVMKTLSTLDTPPGIAAVVNQQKPGKVDYNRVLLLEDIQDPGNLGTLIRTADAFGFKTVLVTPKSADPYNPKVLRGAQGSHFHLNILQREAAEAAEAFKGIKIGTSLNDAVYIDDFNKPDGDIMLVLGNEGQGLSDETLGMMDINAKINMPGSSESLNVAIAGAIMMHHFKS